uniref:Uncharacterized protein n=1 Tax=Chrysotila carterae TaxID=13221 RepID=A0A7S4AY79_CHRCT
MRPQQCPVFAARSGRVSLSDSAQEQQLSETTAVGDTSLPAQTQPEKSWRRTASRAVLNNGQDVAVVSGALATWALHNRIYASLGPVAASSVVGLLSGVLLPTPLALAAYCGSFSGMATVAVVPTLPVATASAVACAAMLRQIASRGWLVGMGGRLGLLAQLGCTLLFCSLKLLSAFGVVGDFTPLASCSLFDPAVYGRTRSSLLGWALSGSLLGAFGTRLWQHIFKQAPRLSNSVTATTSVTLLACLALPKAIHGPVFAGAFVAMSSAQVLADRAQLALAAVACAFCQVLLAGVFNGGWAGKLGTCSFLGVALAKGLRHLTTATGKKAAAE